MKSIPLKSVKFQTEIILNNKLVKGISSEDYDDLEVNNQFVSFSHNSRLFLVPLSNINLMEQA